MARVAGHFGELIQGRLGPKGPVVLMTLPCPHRFVTATLSTGPLHLHHTGAKVLTLPRLRRFLALLDLPLHGRFVLRVGMPVGGGAGASTAALVAIARAAGADEARIQQACLALEGASDPLMLPAPGHVLWASRLGRVLGRLAKLPGMEVIGGFHGPPQTTRAGDCTFPDVSDLLTEIRRPDLDVAMLARLATSSADRCLALRGPEGDPTRGLMAKLGALGYAIAHTGSARALLFAPGAIPSGAADALRTAGFTGITRFQYGGV